MSDPVFMFWRECLLKCASESVNSKWVCISRIGCRRNLPFWGDSLCCLTRYKVLTFVFWGAIICKSLARAASRAGKLGLQLNTNSADERLWKSSKKLEKSSWQRVWKVVIYLSCAKRRAPCKLNNVMNTKHQILDSLSRSSIAWSGTTLNFFEAMINGFNNLIWAAWLFKYHFIESLILAQDERWRRA